MKVRGILWQCERRHDTACEVYVTTDDNGVVIKQPTVIHNHAIPVGRAEALVVRSNILTEAERRPEAAPAALLNEFVTPAVIVPCGHCVCSACMQNITSAAVGSSRCPVCRADIPYCVSTSRRNLVIHKCPIYIILTR